MSGLKLIVSKAGREALPNPEHTGTQAVTITHVGVTETAFIASDALMTLPGELKRMSTLSGAAVAPDTMHIMIRDESSDTYSMRGFGLYLADGTLFASYGQGEVIMEKSAQAMLLLAADTVFADIDAASLVFGDATWNNPPATTETQGVVRLAADAIAAAGDNAQSAMTPRGVRLALDARIGASAPTALAKSLLSMATAALMRTALGLGTASVRNEGAGGGLDADVLDGQHGSYYLDWGNLSNRPAAFPPTIHGHAWGDLSGIPATASRWPAWGEVTGKPSAFTPASHGHAWGDLSGIPATASRWPAWGEVTGKPSTYAPGAHKHDASDIDSGRLTLDRMPTSMGMHTSNVSGTSDLDAKLGDAGGIIGWTGSATGSPTAYTYAGMHLAWSATAAAQFGFVLSAGSDDFSWRCANSSGWGVWRTAWHNGNQLALGMTPTSARSALGLGTAAQADIGTSGASVPRTNTANTWSAKQTFNVGGAVPVNQPMEFGAGAIRGASTAMVVGGAGGRILLRPNGDGATAGEASLSSAGLFSAPALDASSGSDERLKTDLGPNPYGLAEVLQIATKTGRYLPIYTHDDRKRLFVIAQQVAPLMPELVLQDGIEIDGEQYCTVDYLGLIPVLINAMQQLHGRLLELEAR